MDIRLARPDQARLDAIEAIKSLVAGRFTPALRRRYEDWSAGRPEATLRDRRVMQDRFGPDPVYQAGRGLARITQEAMWAAIRRGYEPRRAELERALADGPDGAGVTLALDPSLVMPAYFRDTEFHLQTGGFAEEPLAGVMYETGVAAYSMHRYGRAMDEMGKALLAALPQRDWTRVLYVGCGPAYKAYPLRDAMPGAEFHAIDLSAPMLRHAAMRAAAQGRRIHFHQMNAEDLSFPDGHFDLVFNILLLHELPGTAIGNLARSAQRVLAPGGVFASVELPHYAAVDPLSAWLLDWDATHNGEPFWRAFHELDLDALLRAAGFADVGLAEHIGAGGREAAAYAGRFRYHVTLATKARA